MVPNDPVTICKQKNTQVKKKAIYSTPPWKEMWVQSLRHIHTCQGKNYSFELARALQPQVSKVEMNATNMVALHSMMGMMAHMARNEQGHPCYSKNLTTHCASWNLTILRINWSYIQNM